MLRFLARDLNLNLEDLEIKDRYGDISFNIFKISKKYSINSEIIEKELEKNIKSSIYIKKVEKINGFINLYLNWPKVLTKFLKEKIVEEKIIANKILVEHTSANPNKALHVGHLRNACLGDSIYRFLKKLGNKVYVANYIDDTGSQMAELLIAFRYLNKNVETEEKFDLYCGKIYAEVNRLLETDENIKKLKSIIIKDLERKNSFISEFNREIVNKIVLSQLKTLWYLDIYFDFLNKESDILNFGLWNETFERLSKVGKIEFIEGGEEINKLDEYSTSMTKRKVGTYVIKSKSTDLVLVRSDGTLTYLAKDIAYALWKHGILSKNFLFSEFVKQPNGKILYQTYELGRKIEDFENFDLTINIIGREQAENQYVIEKLINEFSKNKKYVYYSYGLVFLSKNALKELGINLEEEKNFLKMSGRKGLVINVDDLIKKFEEKVEKNLKDRGVQNKDLVRKIVKSCLRYEMIKLDRNKDLIFDFESAMKIDGNSALYLMYTYARINSIIKKLEEKNDLEINEFDCELEEYELSLAKHILMLDSIINSSLKNLEINQIANYCYELAKNFNIFYEKCRIVDEKDRNKKELRKCLLFLTKNIFDFLFEVIGIEKVERI
ncbi:MAG: arginine--tRNA ligase [Candidatus Aenigmatarchaeota archaeon]